MPCKLKHLRLCCQDASVVTEEVWNKPENLMLTPIISAGWAWCSSRRGRIVWQVDQHNKGQHSDLSMAFFLESTRWKKVLCIFHLDQCMKDRTDSPSAYGFYIILLLQILRHTTVQMFGFGRIFFFYLKAPVLTKAEIKHNKIEILWNIITI